MRKTAIFTLVSLLFTVALPAQASLADRFSDEVSKGAALPAPYSGQVVRQGEVQSEESVKARSNPAPYSGRVVIRGEVKSDGRI